MMSSPDESKSIVSLKKTKVKLLLFDIDLTQAETISAWDDKIQSILSTLDSNTNAAVPLLESYIKSLKVQQSKCKDRETCGNLNEIILMHLALLKTKIDCTCLNVATNHQYFEDILAIYASLELNIVADLFKNLNVQSSKVQNQLEALSEKILTNLKQSIIWKDLNVVHCLLKLKYDRKSPACVSLMKIMYHQILFNSTIKETDDFTLCGFYMLFYKYKRFIPTEERDYLLLSFLGKFNKKCSFLNDFPMLREIMCLDHNHQADLNCSKGKVHIVNNYFKYIKDEDSLVQKEKLSSLFDKNFSNQHQNGVKHTLKSNNSFNKNNNLSIKSNDAKYEVRRVCNNDSEDGSEKCASFQIRSKEHSMIIKSTNRLFNKSPQRSYEKNKRTRLKDDIPYSDDDDLQISPSEERIISFVDSTSIDNDAAIDDSVHCEEEKTIFLVGSTDVILDFDTVIPYVSTYEDNQTIDSSDRQVNEQLPEVNSTHIASSRQEDVTDKQINLSVDNIKDDIGTDATIISSTDYDTDIKEQSKEVVEENQCCHVSENANHLSNNISVISSNISCSVSIGSLNIKHDYECLDMPSPEITTIPEINPIEERHEEESDSKVTNEISVSIVGRAMYLLDVDSSGTENANISEHGFIDTDVTQDDTTQYLGSDLIDQKPIIINDCQDRTKDQNVIISQLQEYLSITKQVQLQSCGNNSSERKKCKNTTQTTIEQEMSDAISSDNLPIIYNNQIDLDSNKNSTYFVDRTPQLVDSSFINADSQNAWHSADNYYTNETTFKSWEPPSALGQDKSNYNIQFGYETPPKDGICDQDFLIGLQNTAANMQIAHDNGFLTPENEQELNNQQIFLSQCAVINNSLSTNIIENSEDQQFAFPSNLKTLSMDHNSVKIDYPRTLDLTVDSSRKFYVESAFGCGTHAVDAGFDTSSNKLGRKRSAITFKGNLVVKKFHCNNKMMSRLTMPPLIDDICDNEVTSTTKKVPNSASKILRMKKLRQKRMTDLCLDMDINKAFAQLNHEPGSSFDFTCNSRPASKPKPKTIQYYGVEFNDPKLFTMTPIVDLSQFAAPYSKKRTRRIIKEAINTDYNENNRMHAPKHSPHEPHAFKTSENLSPTHPVIEGEIKTETVEEMETDVLKEVHQSNYTDDDINLLLQALKSSTETRLPFKKRRMALPEEEVPNEISYPATPMVSIAELETIQPSNSLLTLPVSISPVIPDIPSGGQTYLPEMSSGNEDVSYNLSNIYPTLNILPYDAYLEMNLQQAFPYKIGHFKKKDNFMNSKYVHVQSTNE